VPSFVKGVAIHIVIHAMGEILKHSELPRYFQDYALVVKNSFLELKPCDEDEADLQGAAAASPLRRSCSEPSLSRSSSNSARSTSEDTEPRGLAPGERRGYGFGLPAVTPTLDDSASPLGEMPSMGSDRVLHDAEMCKPCPYHLSISKPCRYQAECKNCHFMHERKGKHRPSRRRRENARKIIDNLDREAAEAYMEKVNKASQSGIINVSYSSRVIAGRLKKEDAAASAKDRTNMSKLSL